MPLKRWSSDATADETVATMSGCAWPRMALICPEVKSRIRLPSRSKTCTPEARSMILGVKPTP
jgi:hypothetical protein